MLKQRHINVDATSKRRIDVDTTLFQHLDIKMGVNTTLIMTQHGR